jgi:glycerophosphoryl diester phosphodiesterase
MPLLRLLVCAVLLTASAAAPAAGAPAIHAHRGGPTIGGAHSFGEDTMPAFRNAWERFGAVIEMDVKLTLDRVPVVIHDATLDRVTPCTGRVDAKTFAELAGCPVDVLGSPEGELGGAPAGAPESIPSLAAFLTWARDAGTMVNLEIKNHPQEPDFDPGDAYANTVMDTVVASGFPPQRLIVQSFWPANLDVAKARLPGIQTAFLTLSALNAGAPAFAQGRDFTWVSPQWPVDKAFVDDAHARGRGVVPYTLNQADAVKAAAEVGVDAIITDDPMMARRALGFPDPPAPRGAGGDSPGADRSPPRIVFGVPELASDGSTTPRLVLHWDASDPSGVSAFDADVRARSFGWRVLAENSLARVGVFTATPGERYVLRVRARDAAGNTSAYAFVGFSVPKDLRPRGWRVLRRSRAWMKTVAAPRRKRTARFAFGGTRLRIIAARGPKGGKLVVTLDGRRRTVSTRGPAAHRAVVFDSGPVKAGRHRVRLRARGRVLLDGYATR